MNDLHFIKYIPKLMMLDTLGMSPLGKVAHRQLFDMTIINDGPPQDDDDALRELASCPTSDWARVKGELRLKGYKSIGGYFLHAGTIKTLNESKEEFVRSFNRTCKANSLKPLVLSNPDSVTGCVTYHVTLDVTADADPPMTLTQTDRRTDGQTQSLSTKTTKLPASDKSRFTKRQTELTAGFDKALGIQWENDRQKWMGRIKRNPDKSERVLNDLEQAIKEGDVKKGRAEYAEHRWGEFK
jgi:hypothetical protein